MMVGAVGLGCFTVYYVKWIEAAGGKHFIWSIQILISGWDRTNSSQIVYERVAITLH